MSRSAPDVVVIGGGIVGVSAAAHLAATGRLVTLIERTAIAAGASGRNSGVVQHPFDAVLVALYLETVALYRALGTRAGIDFRLADRPAGLLAVTRDPDAARREATEMAATHPHLDPTFLTPDDLRRLEPSLAEGIAAVRLEIGYPVAPTAATLAYAVWAAAQGVTIRIGQGARPWLTDGRAIGVLLDDGTRMPADAVVVAAGPWSPALIDPSGTWHPIRSTWGVIVAVGLTDPPAHVLEQLDIEIEPDDSAAASELSFTLITAVGASSLGSTFLADEADSEAFIPRLVANGATYLPAIASAPLGAHRVCARPVSLDGRPLIGRVAGVEGLWIAAGHGPWGISTGPASGRLLADLVDGRVGTPPAALDPARFGAPRHVGVD